MKRDYEKGCITYDGIPTEIPFCATSFAALGRGRYIYIENQRFYCLGIEDSEIAPNIAHQQARYVEVCAKDNKYYALSDTGIVRTHSGTPENMRRHYLSLADALEGELS